MDGLRGRFPDFDAAMRAAEWDEEEDVGSDLPVVIGQDERRLQLRAYGYWTNLLGNRPLPSIDDLRLDHMPEFAPLAVLLQYDAPNSATPRITYIGKKLAEECGTPRTISTLDEASHVSLLARIASYYPQLQANRAPIAFAAECQNQRGATLLYRGILLPFADMGHAGDTPAPIRHVLGIVNWKEAADSALSEEIARQIGVPVLPVDFSPSSVAVPAWSAWADGPGEIPPEAERAGAIAALGKLEFAEVPAALAPHMTLVDWLASARELAQAARFSSERSRQALYAAIGRTHDFALVAKGSPARLPGSWLMPG